MGPAALPAYGVTQVLPLTRYWQATGSPGALRLIEGLVRFFVCESGVVGDDGSFRGHVHSWGILPSTVGVLCYAMSSGDEGLVRWCKRVWDFMLANCGSFGWAPDGIGVDDGIVTGETCCITDMVHLGVKLAECGYEECLDYVEIMLRNQLLENQIRDVSRFEFDCPEVRAMTLGAYDSWVMPNGLTGCSEVGLEGCCTASAIRGFYLAWRHAIRQRDGAVEIDLMLTRRSKWVDTVSHQPFEGRFSVAVKEPVTVSIRLPAWIDPVGTTVTIDGAPAPLECVSRRLQFRDAKRGSRIEIEFPIPERQTEEEVRGQTYRLWWRGITLMRIDPPGSIYPIFQRTLDSMAALNSVPVGELKEMAGVEW